MIVTVIHSGSSGADAYSGGKGADDDDDDNDDDNDDTK